MRLIDADKIIVKTFCLHCVDHDECKSECMDLKTIKSMLTSLTEKTVDIDVVRCKDCAYAKPFNKVWQAPIMDALVCTNFDNERVDENFFCGCAIKRR